MLKYLTEIVLSLWVLLFSAGIISIGSFPIKMILLLLFVLLTGILLWKKKRIYFYQQWSVFLLMISISLAVFRGFFNGYYQSAIDEAISLYATIITVVCIILLFDNDFLNVKKMKKIVIITAFTGIAVKVILGFGILFGFLSAFNVESIMQNYFGSPAFDVGVGQGFLGILPRIGDAGGLFNLIVYAFYVKRNNGGTFISWICVLLFILVGYSRYLMACFGVITLWLMYTYLKSLKLSIKSIVNISLLLVIGCYLVFFDFGDDLYAGVLERYMGDGQAVSDSIRSVQQEAILPYIIDSFAWGIGLGGYTSNCIRSPIHLWQYELEYLALFMQLGLLGFLCIIINFIQYLIRKIWINHDDTVKYPVIISLFFWLITPFQSSLFVGTPAALIGITIFLLSRKDIN